MAVEETKTSDDESRSTGVSQRGSKFVYINFFAPRARLYMLYNDELGERENKMPSNTNIFGTNILLALGLEIVGKSAQGHFKAFSSVDELVQFKSSMRRPPAGNIPIDIVKRDDVIFISGRLAKPAGAGNIGHDPTIGALSMISACIRKLGWNGDIVITKHGTSQTYVDKNRSNNFLHIAHALGITFDGINLSEPTILPDKYWHKEHKKKGGYKIKNGVEVENLYLPDLILCDEFSKSIIVIEGKKLKYQSDGLAEIKNYYGIKEDCLDKYYQDYDITMWVSLFGGKIHSTQELSPKVILYTLTALAICY